MKDFLNAIHQHQYFKHAKKTFVVATVIGIEGNSFRRTGFRILFSQNGEWHYEGESGTAQGIVLKAIQSSINNQKTSILKLDTSTEEGKNIGIALGYRGLIQLFFNPYTSDSHKVLQQCISSSSIKVLMTVLEATDKDEVVPGARIIYPTEERLTNTYFDKTLAKNALSCAQLAWQKGRSTIQSFHTEKGQIKVFCEIITPQPQIVLFGSQYDIYPLVEIAQSIGWKVILIANPDKLRSGIFQKVDQVLNLDEINQVSITPLTAFIIMSHLFERDADYLLAALKTSVPYIGMLGPHRRFDRMFAQIAAKGIDIHDLDQKRVHAPMGLDIGASTQEEMAISIIAEVRAFFNDKRGGFLKKQKGDIHSR